MPPVDSLSSVNASMLLSPNLTHYGENWIESVSKSLHMVKATCSAFADKLESDEKSRKFIDD